MLCEKEDILHGKSTKTNNVISSQKMYLIMYPLVVGDKNIAKYDVTLDVGDDFFNFGLTNVW